MKLDSIHDPGQLKELSDEELSRLAREIRNRMVDTVSQTGGHLAPNLGVVELTLAIHQVFNSPVDKIIWDVGHQSYVHKLVTGRVKEFSTLRQYGGLSGFPKREESPHDPFDTGHSSTSISAALGLALARDLKGEKNSIVAVIGDGALTGGMAFEALNYAGHLQTDIIVILNDNEMSIANNVGALSSYLSRLRTDPMYYKGKEEIEAVLKKIPAIGTRVVKAVDRIKDSLKYLMVPGMIFEELGFTYLGPIDGHNIQAIKKVLQNAKSTRGPVLVHVLTTKGKGYKPAEMNPDQFHGIGPFDIETGTPLKNKSVPTYTEVFAQTLVKLAENDERIIGITAAMPAGTGLDLFSTKFKDRFFDVGIAEQNAVTMAAGLAAGGFKPVVAIYSTFMQRAFDQVVHDVCMQKLPVVLAMDRAGIVGEDGETHQGLFDLSFLRGIPNLTMMMPKDENELQHMLSTALEMDGPCAVRYPRGKGMGVALEASPYQLPVGKAELLREGSDAVVVAIGPVVYLALEAADILAKRGVEIAVINARFIKPLDTETILEWAVKTKRVVTLEEHILAGGFGSAVLELLCDSGQKDIRVERIGVPDQFVEHGSVQILRQKLGITTETVIQAVNRLVGLKVAVQR